MKQVFILFFLVITCSLLSAQSDYLKISPEDIIIEQSVEGGYDLWVKKKSGMNSILLTESTEDADGTSYALRNTEYHPVNGNEKRILDGEFLDSPLSRYSLIDSTPEDHPILASAFHIFIPYVVEFGYPWTRYGKVQILDGSFIDIRAFSKKYGDYSGEFRDNAFLLKFVQKASYTVPEPEKEAETEDAVETAVNPDIYMSDTVEVFSDLSKQTSGDMIFGKGEGDVIENMRRILDSIKGDTLDLVLALDTTQSMENDIPYLQESLVPLLKEYTDKFSRLRIGMMLYRDYFEEYVTRIIPFQITMDDVQDKLNTIRIFGGRDIPEAVYEALYESIHEFDWEAEEKAIVLIGDAPPHPLPRGEISKEMVLNDSIKAGININTIILPQ